MSLQPQVYRKWYTCAFDGSIRCRREPFDPRVSLCFAHGGFAEWSAIHNLPMMLVTTLEPIPGSSALVQFELEAEQMRVQVEAMDSEALENLRVLGAEWCGSVQELDQLLIVCTKL